MSALTDLFTSIANAIRTKKGTSETIVASDFPTEIENLPSGGNAIAPEPKASAGSSYTFVSAIISINFDFKSKSLYNTSNRFFYGYDNVENINIQNTEKLLSFNQMFSSCRKLKSVNNFSVNSASDFYSMFNYCSELISLPSFQFNHDKNNKKFQFFCSNCTSLENVPIMDLYSYNTSSNAYLQNMFASCPALTNDSLNNILASLATATTLTANKTLKHIGLSETQATTCTTLSNWQALSEAGWTTGY